jgi:RecB family endonuclease NucS
MTNFKYGNQFFDTQEDVNAYILEKEFNKQLKWFNDFNRHPRFDHIDYDAKDKKGRKVHIELKQRKGTIDDFKRFGDVIIEPTKLEAFAKVMES